MKKSQFLLFLSVLATTNLFSQPQSYDMMKYSAPAGWVVKDATGSRSYTIINNINGTYGMIAIYPAIKSSGSAETDFSDTWSELVKTSFGTQTAPVAVKLKRADGYDALSGSAAGLTGGKKTVVTLVNYTGGGNTLTVIINYSDAGYRDTTNKILQIIRLEPLPATEETSTAVASTVQISKSDGSMGSLIDRHGISGVWMGLITSNFEVEMKCITVFSNGELREIMPQKGFRDLDPIKDKTDFPNNWGTYKKEGDQYGVTKPLAVNYKGRLKFISEKKIEFDGDTYQRVDPFDGFRLDGSYTSLADPDETLVVDNLEPVITFYPDGRFTDKGILLALDVAANRSDQTGGNGTYEIKSYTITLAYDDGRVKNYSITGFLNSPAISDKSIVIANAKLNKRL